MKTTILLTSFILLSVSVLHAQIEKGRVQIGGNINFSHAKNGPTDFNPGYKSTAFGVAPSIGKFYHKNKLAGIFLNYSYADQVNNSFLQRQFGGGVFFRQYLPVVNKLYVLFHEQAGYFYQNGKDVFGRVHGQSVNLAFTTGMAYDITKRMQLELVLNNLLDANYTKTNRTELYSINTSLQSNTLSGLALGFRFYLK